MVKSVAFDPQTASARGPRMISMVQPPRSAVASSIDQAAVMLISVGRACECGRIDLPMAWIAPVRPNGSSQGFDPPTGNSRRGPLGCVV